MRVARNGLVMVMGTTVLGFVLCPTGRGTAEAVPVAVQGTANAAGRVNTDVEQLIRHKEVELSQAQVDSNAEDAQKAQAARVTLDHLYADDLVHTSASGKDISNNYFFTRVWVKDKEKGWQIVAYQGTFVPSDQQPQRRRK